MEQALALDPTIRLPFAYGNALTMAGRPKEAVEFLKRAMRLDPHNPARYLAELDELIFPWGRWKRRRFCSKKR